MEPQFSIFWTILASGNTVATMLPDDKIVQKMPNCGSIGPNFANLLNNIGWSDNVYSFW